MTLTVPLLLMHTGRTRAKPPTSYAEHLLFVVLLVLIVLVAVTLFGN
jgi:hypothetical protein